MYFILCSSVSIVKCNSVNAGWLGLLLNIWNLIIKKKLILQITWNSRLHTVIINRRDAFDIYWSKNTKKELVYLLLSTLKKNEVIRYQFFVYSPKWSMFTLLLNWYSQNVSCKNFNQGEFHESLVLKTMFNDRSVYK